MKPDFSDYIIAVLFELEDGLPHSIDQCVTEVLKRCDIEYDIPLMGHPLQRKKVYNTSIKATITLLEANGIVQLDDDQRVMLTRKGKKYTEANEREMVERWDTLYQTKLRKDRQKDDDIFNEQTDS